MTPVRNREVVASGRELDPEAANLRVTLSSMSRIPDPPSRPPRTAWAAAIGMLARRDLSEGEVRTKLLAREFAEDEVEAALSRLLRRRYLDDRSLAAAVVRTQARTKHHGPLKVKAYLQRRQIPEELGQEAIRAEFPEGAENERAVIALQRMGRRASGGGAKGDSAIAGPEPQSRKETGRLFRRLVSRGYSWEAARHALWSGINASGEERDREIER